jgi:hypothetical protein
VAITLKIAKTRLRNKFDLWDEVGLEIVPEDLLTHVINQAQLAVRLDLKDKTANFYSTTVVNQREYSLPTSFLHSDETEVWYGRDTSTGYQGVLLTPVPHSKLVPAVVRDVTSPVPSGTPLERYSLRDFKTISFDPLPSQAKRYDIFFLEKPTDLSDDDDTLDFEPEFENLVVYKSMVLLAEDLSGFASDEHERRYQRERRILKPISNSSRSRRAEIAYNGRSS